MKTDRAEELVRKQAKLSAEKDDLKKRVEEENRAMTPEEKKRLGELITEIRCVSEELILEREDAVVDDILNQSLREPIRPEVRDAGDKLGEKFPGLPKKELRYSSLAEFTRDVISAHPSRNGRYSEKLQANVRAATGMGEAAPADGGFLVQPDLSARLIEPLMDRVTGDPVLSRLNQTTVTGNGLTFSAIDETTRSTSNWGGILMYWLGEGSEKTASSPKLRRVELKLKKIAGLLYLTDELMEDAPALASRVENGFRIALRSALVKAIVNGTGTGQPLGLLQSTAKIAIAAETGQEAATLVTDNILNMRERLTPGALSPVWLYNPTCYKQLFKLQVGLGTAGALVSGQTIQSAGMQSMLGIPMVECPWCSVLGTAGDLILTDLGQYEFISKGVPNVGYSIHVKFIYDETAMRIVYRCDGQPAQVAATTLEDGALPCLRSSLSQPGHKKGDR